MTAAWSWFIAIGTLASLCAFLWLLFANRHTSGEETTGHESDGIQELDNPLPMWWIGMFTISIVFALGYLVYYPGLGNFPGTGNWTSADQHEAEQTAHETRFAPVYAKLARLDPAELASDPTARQVGRRLFVNNCATCHGVNGRGSFGFPDLTDGEWIWGGGFDAVKASIVEGRNAVMPPWGPALGDGGVADVTQTVLMLAGREHDSAAAARGRAAFDSFCVSCHGSEGEGNVVFGAPNLTNDIWLYGRSADEIAYTIREGRAGVMPSHKDVLSADQTQVLAAYVHSLQARTGER